MLRHRPDFEETLLLEEFKSVEISEGDDRTVGFFQVPDQSSTKALLLAVRLDRQEEELCDSLPAFTCVLTNNGSTKYLVVLSVL